MMFLKTISYQVNDPILHRLKHALRSMLETAVWTNKEQDLQAWNEQSFLSSNSIDHYFPNQINLGGAFGVVSLADNKKVYRQDQIVQVVEHVRGNPELYYDKKNIVYDYREIKSKLSLSKDQFLYFVALTEEKELIRFSYRKDFYLAPLKHIEDVQSIFVAKRNIEKFNKNQVEELLAANAINEIKQQLDALKRSEKAADSVDINPSDDQLDKLKSVISDKSKSDIPEVQEQKNTVTEPEKEGPIITKKTPPVLAKTSKPKQAVSPKDTLVESAFKFLAEKGAKIRESIYDFNERAREQQRSSAERPLEQKKEYSSDNDYFTAAIKNIKDVDLADFFTESLSDKRYTRLEHFSKDFNDFTLPVGGIGHEKIYIRSELAKIILQLFHRDIALTLNVAALHRYKLEPMLEIILAFNVPAWAEELDAALKHKISWTIFMGNKESASREEKEELKELRLELMGLHFMIMNKFSEGFASEKLQKKGSLLDIITR